MESLESLLRDEFRASEGIERSSVADLIASTRRGGQRRKIVHVASSVIAIAAIVALVATAIVRTTATRLPAVPTPAPSTIASILKHPGQPTGGRFVDAKHGFLTLSRCPSGDYETCREVLEATSDGGATFHELPLPAGAVFDPGIGAQLYIFDATHLVIAQEEFRTDRPAAPSEPNAGSGARTPITVPAGRWISSDAGRTWAQVPTRSGQPVTQIPEGAPLVNAVDTGTAGALTADGVTHPLTPAGSYQLPFGAYEYAFAGPTGGSYFLLDWMAIGEKSGSTLRVSRDRGRTWQATHLPAGVDSALVIGADGGWIYAAASRNGVIRPYSGVLASSDGGVTWELVDLPDERISDAEGSAFAISPQGGLLYCDGVRVWRLVAAGTFYRLPEAAATVFPVGLGPVVVATRVNGGGHVSLAVSTDGSRWPTSSIR